MKTKQLNQDQLAAEYAAGATTTSLAEKYSVSPSTIHKNLKAAGAVLRTRGVVGSSTGDNLGCSTCGLTCKPAQAHEVFYRDRKSKSGFASECKTCAKKARLANYHKTKPISEYETVLAAQGGKCGICGCTAEDSRNHGLGRLILDKDANGVTFGVLCRSCKAGIEAVNRDPAILRRMVSRLQDQI